LTIQPNPQTMSNTEYIIYFYIIKYGNILKLGAAEFLSARSSLFILIPRRKSPYRPLQRHKLYPTL